MTRADEQIPAVGFVHKLDWCSCQGQSNGAFPHERPLNQPLVAIEELVFQVHRFVRSGTSAIASHSLSYACAFQPPERSEPAKWVLVCFDTGLLHSGSRTVRGNCHLGQSNAGSSPF
jgi:hypothetical protein